MARPYTRSNQLKSALVAEYLEQQDEEAMQALVTAGAFMALADGQVQLVERDELLNFVDSQGLVSPTSRCEIGEIFDSRVRQFESARSFDAVAGALRPLAGSPLGSAVVRSAERIAAADRDLHPSEVDALRFIRRILTTSQADPGGWQ
jgi:tellurite resistance protein